VFRLPSSWVWDFWFADDGEHYHLFFLKASRALHDPDRRHWRATIGHAVSADLRHWTEVSDAIVPSDGPAFDDLATWTGSVVQAPDGTWRMFYTGVNRAGSGLVQRIGAAISSDLHTWRRLMDEPVVEPDPRWYERLTDADADWPDEAWRDPWVFADDAGDGWHKLVTARANEGEPRDRGVVGHARSHDLSTWTVEPPLSKPDGFGQLEVLQVADVDGRSVLLFSCMTPQLSDSRLAEDGGGGIWAVNIDDHAGPFDLSAAYRLHDESLYVGRLIQERDGAWVLLAFRNLGVDGEFGGEITDPIPVAWGADGRLRLVLP
jgi:beta-fructofuranosidase